MDLSQFSDLFSGQDIFNLFFKVFAVVLSFLYLIYALVIFKQTQVMTRTLEGKRNALILLISLTQIIIGVLLLIISLLIV